MNLDGSQQNPLNSDVILKRKKLLIYVWCLFLLQVLGSECLYAVGQVGRNKFGICVFILSFCSRLFW